MKPSCPILRMSRRLLGISLLLAQPAAAGQPPAVPAPTGTPVRADVSRDTWFSDVGPEVDGSNGGSGQLKLKSIQEMSLIDIDPAPLKGRVITGATLHVHLSGPEILHRVTVGSFGAEWVEGTATGYARQAGSSTFNSRQHPNVPWAYPGSNLNSVMLGQGGTLWRMADAFPPDAGRWQKVAIDPSIIAARVAGVSTGFLLFDDTGAEWTREGERFTTRGFPNRFVHSKDSNRASAPYLTIYLGEADTEPPATPTDLKFEISDLPAGEARVSWLTPADAGPAGVAGFFVDVDGQPVPRYLVPAAGRTGERVTMHLRDLGFRPGQAVAVGVKAVDGAGNISPVASLQVVVSQQTLPPLPGKNGEPLKAAAPLPKLGDAEIAIIDALDKVQPVTGAMIPPQEPGYLAGNHLWDGRRIRLFGAAREVVSFQILVRGKVDGLKAEVHFPQHDKAALPQAEFFRFRHVNSKSGPMPDPLLPMGQNDKGLSVPDPDENMAGQTSGSILCELPLSELARPEEELGTLTLSAGGQTLNIPLSLTTWDFSLPESLSFLPEMNSYGLPDNEADYYRLAHRNRTVLNRVPYHQNGSLSPGCAPIWDPKTRKLDWTAWDKRFGPYFDGTAFRDGPQGQPAMPRQLVPLEVFYLPLFENWPTPMEGNYNGDYWADRAFPESYRKDFIEVSRQFAEHFNGKGWNDTIFQCFFNGKTNFKANGWSRGTCPWLLDEPANFQDYWALRYFGELFHEGVNLAPPGKAKMMFRADISRPEWQRDSLDHVLDYNVVGGGAFRQFQRIVLDRKQQFGQIVIPYGGSNDPADSNVQPAAWCLDSWTLGGDGVLPWQTIGENDSWKKADALSLFYPGGPAGLPGPVPSIRLKSYLRGQQDVEYLTLLAIVEKQSRYLLGQRVRAVLPLAGEKHGTGFAGEDAGVIDFGRLRPQELWALRMRVGEALSAAHPERKSKLIDLRTPRRDPSHGAAGYVSAGERANVHAEGGGNGK
ncbi:MAG: hypothetical protein JWO87_1484 [Phycisphaerales bacterium]|nr:hypothetical protein [Phycisphaerales bacterium]